MSMKRLLALIVLIFGLALAGTLPDDPRFDVPVTVRTGPGGMALEAVLDGAARSVNLTPMLREIPPITLRLDWIDKPFRQLWQLLIDTYSDGKLDYVLLDNDVVLVAPPEVIARVVGEPEAAPPPPPESGEAVQPIVRKFYPIRSGDPLKIAEFLMKEVQGIVATVVPGQQVLAVRGTDAQQQEVQRILGQITAPVEEGPPIFQRTFRLSHAKAEEAAKVLAEAMQARQAQSQVKVEAGAGEQQVQATIPEKSTISIVADTRTNTLIVTGTAKQLELVEELIKKLDFPVQQVNVQVRIQEVTQTLVRNLGLKWNTISGGNIVSSIVDNGLSLIFDATRSLASLNIVATLEALEKQGLSRTVNDSNITVLNNQTGFIQSGFTIFIKRVVGDKVEKIPYDIGVIVKVTPQITADGQIVLRVESEVSDIKERNPVDGDVDVVSKQKSETTLRLDNGQTVVLGGLIKTKRDKTTQGVPVLMHIPVLGSLFKQTTVNNEDNELLIVITANIINHATAAATESTK